MAVQDASRLVFVPAIGFRPAGTRTLQERADTTQDQTRLAVLAVAASTERTDIVVEWQRDSATCTPDSRVVPALIHGTPRAQTLNAIVLARTNTVRATSMSVRFYSMSDWIRSVQTMTFPKLPNDADGVELRVSWAGHDWRVPFALVPANVTATPLAVQTDDSGVIMRATAVTRNGDELIVAVEAEARWQIRQVGAPLPTPSRFSGDTVEFRRERVRGLRHAGWQADPIWLEDDRGGRTEELERLFSLEPQQSAPAEPFFSRFSVVFEAPSTDVNTAVIVVPFVALNDFEHSVTADLRDVPLDLQLGEHLFRVVRTEADGEDKRRITMEIQPSTASPRFVQPARVLGADLETFAWESHAADPASPRTIWMATAVGDPPIVTFKGAVLRADGPFRLEIPLP